MVTGTTLRTLVVIPAWNEEASLPTVLAELAECRSDLDVLVVNDGSTDGTPRVARHHGARVLDSAINLGVGGAMRLGYKYAARNDYDVVVQLDADGQHDPREIGELLRVLDEGPADIVVGARFADRGDYEAHGLRRWTMRLLSAVLSRIVGTRLTDTTSGFKAAGPRAVELFARDYPAEYLGDTVESLVIAHRAGLTISQTGVAMRRRLAGNPSQRPWRAGIFLLRATLALVVALSRPADRRGGRGSR